MGWCSGCVGPTNKRAFIQAPKEASFARTDVHMWMNEYEGTAMINP